MFQTARGGCLRQHISLPSVWGDGVLVLHNQSRHYCYHKLVHTYSHPMTPMDTQLTTNSVLACLAIDLGAGAGG
jgi:hypothetical protein